MQEKFLKKPPPRYVYDIIISTMGVTGFPKGLFTEDELNAKFFDESPQNKLEIFQKTIDITKIVLNENFEIKTTNILKGEEPEKTNSFLLAFHKAATSGKDFNKFITKYLEHKKKKAEEKKKQPEETKTQVPQNNQPKEQPKEQTKEQVKEQPKEQTKPEKPSSSDKSAVDKSKTPSTTTNTQKARPQTPGKRPDKVTSETKEVKEDTNKTSKMPQGLISDKEPIEVKKPQSKPTKENKEEDFGPTKAGTKIKMTSKIGKFSDVLSNDENPKQSTKSFSPNDLESIKNYVQEISKNSNPIGKIIDFLGDDVESMNKELQSWIKEAKTYKERYDEEVKKSDEVLLPLQNEFLELEETIRDEHMRIKSMKSRMIKNEQIIQNLINNVISIKNESGH